MNKAQEQGASRAASRSPAGVFSPGLVLFVGLGLAPMVAPAQEAPPPLPLPNLPPPSATQQQGLLPPQGFGTAPQIDSSQLVFEIPPVFQRPLGVDEGGRIFVREFVISGVIDDAEAGILKDEIDELIRQRFEDLNQLLSRLRIERQDQESVGPDGFTPEEREAIIDFMAEVVRDLAPDRQVAAYQAFVDQLRIQRLDRSQGLTIGQLQLVADEVTRYYRQKGFFLARAVIPAQEVVDGVVMIRVLEGRLGGVIAEGNDGYSDARIADPFEPHLGQLITVDKIEDSLLTLQDYPGLSAVGVFQPGRNVGTADILINVSSEDYFGFLVRGDNHGTRITGEQRLLAEASWYNPAGYADSLRLTLLQTYEPDNSLFGALKYELPLGNPRHRIGLEATRNTFDVANLSGAAVGNEVGGVSEIGSLFYLRNFVRTRDRKFSGKASLAVKNAETSSSGQAVTRIISSDEIAVLGLEGNYESINSESATITSAYVRLDGGLDGALGVPTVEEVIASGNAGRSGTDDEGNTVVAASDFIKLSAGYSWLKSLTVNQTLLFRVNGQYSEDLLTSVEEFSMGGPASVRAVPSSQFLTDSGAFASVEWGVRAPGFADKPAFANRNWGDVLRFTVFYDYAYGKYSEFAALSAGENDFVEAGGAGVGLDFGLPGVFRLNVQWARLTNGVEADASDVTNPRAILEDDQVWVDLTFEF